MYVISLWGDKGISRVLKVCPFIDSSIAALTKEESAGALILI
jgi:hypothetical protein